VGGPDPLGKRALYWLPVGEQATPGGDGRPLRSVETAGGVTPGRSGHARPTGKRALFSATTPAGEEERVGSADPRSARGMFTVACSSCGSVTRVRAIELLVLHVPIAAWLPRRTFDRWMTCPSCRRRCWTSVTLSR
jgi:hypothetical protein